MALLQGIITLITRSIGKIFSALFHWAVIALFGRWIQRVWGIYGENPEAHQRAWPLSSRVDVAAEIARRSLPFDEWQVVYRQNHSSAGRSTASRKSSSRPSESRARSRRHFPGARTRTSLTEDAR